jgi:hypothetical protein
VGVNNYESDREKERGIVNKRREKLYIVDYIHGKSVENKFRVACT